MVSRCVECGHGVDKLYIQYSPGNIRLLKCSNCKSVADEYIECDLLILIIDLILHKPQAYRHLLCNLLHRKSSEFNSLLINLSPIFLCLDAYKLWILNTKILEYSSVHILGMKILGCSILGNMLFFLVFIVFSKKILRFFESFCGFEDLLLIIVVSSYFKIYTLSMLVWEFPTSVVYIIDLIVMSSNLVALWVISKSSFRRCAILGLGAHALKFLVNWVLT